MTSQDRLYPHISQQCLRAFTGARAIIPCRFFPSHSVVGTQYVLCSIPRDEEVSDMPSGTEGLLIERWGKRKGKSRCFAQTGHIVINSSEAEKRVAFVRYHVSTAPSDATIRRFHGTDPTTGKEDPQLLVGALLDFAAEELVPTQPHPAKFGNLADFAHTMFTSPLLPGTRSDKLHEMMGRTVAVGVLGAATIIQQQSECRSLRSNRGAAAAHYDLA